MGYSGLGYVQFKELCVALGIGKGGGLHSHVFLK